MAFLLMIYLQMVMISVYEGKGLIYENVFP